MMSQLTAPTRDIVAKLWKQCNVLREEVTYFEYVTELTFLLFLKMLEETQKEFILPDEYRWRKLSQLEGEAQINYYKQALLDLGTYANDPCTRAIFYNARTSIDKPIHLKTLTLAIDNLDWFSARKDGLGDLYEGLLHKIGEGNSKAGQYFTPRALIDCIIRLLKPQPGELIQDPAAGTGGFLVAAHEYIKANSDNLFALNTAQQYYQINQAYVGMELIPGTHRLCLMNLILHGIQPDPLQTMRCGDTLSPEGESLPKADVILTNPPFGTKQGGGRPNRSDFSITAGISNKQLAFVEHIYRALKPNGRAAVVLPDNVLFEDNTGRRLRTEWLSRCNVHTILRLPTGIFYAQGVKTNVVFFTRAPHEADRDQTQAVWVYDMRANAPSYGKTRQLTPQDFAEFEACYGDDPHGRADRQDQGETGRFRQFDRAWIAQQRNDNLDIAWLRDESQDPEDTLSEPEELATAILTHFRTALEEIEALSEELNPEAPTPEVALSS